MRGKRYKAAIATFSSFFLIWREKHAAESRLKYIEDYDGEYFDNELDEWIKQAGSNKRLDEFVTNILSKHVDDVIADYKKENKYGAIVDPNDWISNMADMPLIMFDPESRTSNKRFTRFN